MKQLITLLAIVLLLGGCVAVPAQQTQRGILGELSGDIKIGEDLEVVGDASIGDDLTVTGDLTVSGSTTVSSSPSALEIGGGYGGGYSGGSGCTITTAGAILCDAALYSRGTLGVTGAVTTTGALDVGGTLNFGANNLYVVGHATSGKAIVSASAATAADGHITVASGLTSIDSALVSVCQTDLSAAPFATAVITTTSVTFNAWDVNRNNRVNGITLCYVIVGSK